MRRSRAGQAVSLLLYASLAGACSYPDVEIVLDAAGAPRCGDGNVDPDELCDGDCPRECPEVGPSPCDRYYLVDQGPCRSECRLSLIIDVIQGDGCCPIRANRLLDVDCVPACGDGLLDENEHCDTIIPPWLPGACPRFCDDGDTCTVDRIALDPGGDECSAHCATAPAALGDQDRCCPVGATSTTDPDCPPVCGDGRVDADETCDSAIDDGPGMCPVRCDDGIACTEDSLDTTRGACAAVCVFDPVTVPRNDDRCCPLGATSANDNDCANWLSAARAPGSARDQRRYGSRRSTYTKSLEPGGLGTVIEPTRTGAFE
jgi:hypothetical protein